MNHRKTDRLLELAERERLPLVMFAEGGGGRPGDTDATSVAGLDVPTFRLTARLSGRVPLVAIVSGYCFAGNAALAGACDVIIATPEASLGMGGPAMIEGGGLGVVAPGAVGPMSVQVPNGVVDRRVPDEPAAVAAARRYLSYFRPRDECPAEHADQRVLRHLIPENRVRSYDVRPVIAFLNAAGGHGESTWIHHDMRCIIQRGNGPWAGYTREHREPQCQRAGRKRRHRERDLRHQKRLYDRRCTQGTGRQCHASHLRRMKNIPEAVFFRLSNGERSYI